MVVNAQLTKSQFIRLSILYHIQRKQFYFFALTAAAVTGYSMYSKTYVLLAVVWIPFLMYLGIGIFGAYREGSNENNPVYLPTRYEFSDTGIMISNEENEGKLNWDQLVNWQVIAKTYVLTLKNGQILAFPQNALSSMESPRLKSLLNKHIKV